MFNYEDREDLTQDLLLFYLKRFYVVPNPDEALVVHALKQYATNLLVKRYHRRDYLNSSLADYEANEEFSFTPKQNMKLMLKEIEAIVSAKEKTILQRILAGDSIEQISKDLHISKKTIYKFFEKVRKKLK